MNAYEAYMNELATQMRSELTNHDFNSLETAVDVDNFMNNVSEDETTFVVINSTCGCAAGLARPAAVTVAEQNEKPTNKVTVFAGQDKEATEEMRAFIQQVPSSPSYALFKGKELKHFMPREHIEGRDIQDICMDIKDIFDDYCD